MDVRLITAREDFEAAFSLLDHDKYPLSFYEYALKHDSYQKNECLKLIGAFVGSNFEQNCLATISYRVKSCPQIGKILEIKEIYQKNQLAYESLINFLEEVANDEKCLLIKIDKNNPERLAHSSLDRLENFLKSLELFKRKKDFRTIYTQLCRFAIK